MTDDHSVREVAEALRQSIGTLARRLRLVHVDAELSWGEASALARLDRSGPATSAELARLEQISPQSMGATLKALEERGLIARSPDLTDGRRILLALTDAGRRLRRQRLSARTDQLTQALGEGFTTAEIAQLGLAAPLLDRLAQNL